jgi:hypothetical protein
MNRIIARVVRLGRTEMVEITSKEPKQALVDFISKEYSLPKTQVRKDIETKGNKYYYKDYYISR